jgi:ferritin heavy chain
MAMLRVSPSPAAAANHVSGPAANPASVRVPAPRVSPSACRAAGKGKEVLSGVVFQPFEEIKGELSLARQKFVDECEAAINEQIKYVSLLCSHIRFCCMV